MAKWHASTDCLDVSTDDGSTHLQLPPPRNPAEASDTAAAAREPVTQTVLRVSAAVGVASSAAHGVPPNIGNGRRSRKAATADIGVDDPQTAAAACTAQVHRSLLCLESKG